MFARIAAVCFCVAATPVSADMGALTPLLPPNGQDGAWITATANGAFAMANQSEKGAVRYYYMGTPSDTDTAAAVTLDLSSDADGFAGIIFGFNEQTRGYHVFAAHADGTFTLYQRNSDGFAKLMSSSLDEMPDGPLTIGIEEKDKNVTMSVNGEQMGAIGNESLGDGGVGIVAGGIVAVTFTDFALASIPR